MQATMTSPSTHTHAEAGPVSLTSETLISLTALAQRLDCDLATVHRAARRGTLGRPGPGGRRTRHFLETVKVMGRWFTSEEAWLRYIEASNSAATEPETSSGGNPASPRRRSASERRRASEQAAEACRVLGA